MHHLPTLHPLTLLSLVPPQTLLSQGNFTLPWHACIVVFCKITSSMFLKPALHSFKHFKTLDMHHLPTLHPLTLPFPGATPNFTFSGQFHTPSACLHRGILQDHIKHVPHTFVTQLQHFMHKRFHHLHTLHPHPLYHTPHL